LAFSGILITMIRETKHFYRVPSFASSFPFCGP
jgi:hypothetical protein